MKLLLHLALRLFLIACFVISFTASSAKAEYNAFKLAEALSQYLLVVAYMEYLSSSECAYIVKRNYSTRKTIEDAEPYLRKNDRLELRKLLKSSDLLAEAQIFVEDFFKAGRKDNLDIKTMCGVLAGIFAPMFKERETDYRKALESYSN